MWQQGAGGPTVGSDISFVRCVSISDRGQRYIKVAPNRVDENTATTPTAATGKAEEATRAASSKETVQQTKIQTSPQAT
jgi:hypothetical protein